MQDLDLFKLFLEPLNDRGFNYVVSGSVASIIYGYPRITHDIDLVIELPEFSIKNLLLAFNTTDYYVPPEEVLLIEAKRENRGHFNIIHNETGFKADFYLSGKSEFQEWALENKKTVEVGNTRIPVAPVEYVIIKKLEFYKEGKAQKHLNDINSIIIESGEFINFDFLKQKIKEFALESEWEILDS